MKRTDDPLTAAAVIEDGDHVFVDTSRPRSVLAALASRTDLQDVSVYAYGYPYADASALEALARTSGVTLSVSMVPTDLRSLVDEGTIEFVPRSLYATSTDPYRGVDGRRVSLLQTPADGWTTTVPVGPLSTFGSDLVDAADVTIVEANDRLPDPPSGTRVRADDVDHVVEIPSAVPVFADRPGGDVEARIAEHVVDVLPADPTLQLGIGSVANAIGERLADAAVDVDVWTGLLGDGGWRLIEAGCVGSVTCCIAIGNDASFYDWVAGSAEVEFAPASVSHDPCRLGRLDRLVSVNGGVEVDLTGQVNAETVGGRQISGVGGQLEFAGTANARPDGSSIIAIRSRTASGTPKIVPEIAAADVVTTPRQLVDVVITEWGVADVRTSLRGRAEALVSVAHPDDRPALERAAARRGLLDDASGRGDGDDR